MKRSRMLAAAVICVLLLSAVNFIFNIGRKPFKNLDVSEIAMATVRLTPPDKTIEITDVESLTELLKEVVIYRKDNSYKNYAGQGVVFTLAMTDGTLVEIMAYNPFIVIDSVGYRTKYEPCNALNNYANRLLEQEEVHLILEEPPALSIISDNTFVGAFRGTYSWQRRNYDGTITTVSADSAHPLDVKNSRNPLETREQTAMLYFNGEPDEILNVRCWSDENWDNPAAESEDVAVNGYEIQLKPGGYIYEVQARWDTEGGYGGTANYSFYVCFIP